MSAFIPLLHHRTPEAAVSNSRGQVVRTLHYLRHPHEVKRAASARLLVSRTVFDISARAFQLFGARRLANDAPDARKVLNLANQSLFTRTADGDSSMFLTDAAGRPFWSRNPQSTIITFIYEPAMLPGRLLSKSEQPAGGISRVREQYQYGGMDETSCARNLAGAVILHQDNAGTRELLSVSLSGQPLHMQRRLLSIQADLPDWRNAMPPQLENPLKVTFVRDATGALLTQTNAAGVSTLMTYDITGAVKETRLRWQQEGMEQAALILSQIVRTADMRVLSQRHGNGVMESFKYEVQTLRLARHTVARPACHLQGPLRISDLHYDYDPAGNILNLNDMAVTTGWYRNRKVTGTRKYAYDTLYRLTSATGRERRTADGLWHPYSERYCYDDGDNLIKTMHSGQQAWTHEMAVSGGSNRAVMVPLGKTPPRIKPEEHFLAGGLQKTLPNGRALRWQPDGQLTEVSLMVRGDGAHDTETYRYSDGGTRVRKVRSTAVRGGRQITTVTYVRGSESRQRRNASGRLTQDIFISEAGSVRLVEDRIKNEAHWRYGFTDHLSSVSSETDEKGNLTAREEFSPYGESTGSDNEAVEVAERTRRYAGKERDATGLYYYGWRYYQPQAGRWLSADPGGVIDGVNLFRFCRSNPVSLTDKNGLMWQGTTEGDFPNIVDLNDVNHTDDIFSVSSASLLQVSPPPTVQPGDIEAIIEFERTLAAVQKDYKKRNKRDFSEKGIPENFRSDLNEKLNIDKYANSRAAYFLKNAKHEYHDDNTIESTLNNDLFINAFYPNTWVFSMNSRSKHHNYYANEVARVQYELVSSKNNFYGQLPSHIIRSSVVNSDTIKVITEFDRENLPLRQPFLWLTPNGSSTRRIADTFGLEVTRVIVDQKAGFNIQVDVKVACTKPWRPWER